MVSKKQKQLVHFYQDLLAKITQGRVMPSLSSEDTLFLRTLSLEVRKILTFRSLEREIEEEFFKIEKKIEMLLESAEAEGKAHRSKPRTQKGQEEGA